MTIHLEGSTPSMNQMDDFVRKATFGGLLGANRLGEIDAEASPDRPDLVPKFLVYYLHPEDATFMPLALVEAWDEDEACLKARATD